METPEISRTTPLLQVQNLTTAFVTSEGRAVAADNISFTLHKGETLGIVGESGCGKTVTALSILRLIRKPGIIESGAITYNGMRLDTLSDVEMRAIRGNEIAIVFQEPMTSLNPVYRIGAQIIEPLLQHRHVTRQEARQLAVARLGELGIADPERVFDAWPDELSGGMRQRALIAMAMVCEPKIIIADEPTTAIDATMQMQIIARLQELKRTHGLSVIIITHDLGIIAEICDRVIVMYASHIVEEAPVEMMFHHPGHPYTIGLLESLPSSKHTGERLTVIPGQVPRPTNFPVGCNFQARCNYSSEQCVFQEPPLLEVGAGHFVACWHREKVLHSRVSPPA